MAGKKPLALAHLQSATHYHKLAVYPSNYFITFRRILQTTVRPRVPGGIPTGPRPTTQNKHGNINCKCIW